MALTKGKIIGIIIIILILISVVVIATMVGDTTVKNITILTTDAYSEDGETGIEIESIVETSGTIDATADVEIKYDDKKVVYSGTTKISNNRMLTKIPWENFAIGNEKYTVKIGHGGKTDTYDLYLHQHGWSVCEQVTILPSLTPTFYSETNLHDQPKMNILLSFLDSDGNSLLAAPKDLDISLSIKHEDAAAVIVPISLEEDDLRYHTYIYSYNYNTGGGNYTIGAEVENLFVSSESNYIKFDAETYTGQLNLLPFAVVEINGEAYDGTAINVRRNQDVDFDASGSVNDGEILSYEWDFDYQDFEFTVDATGAEVTHSYSITGTYDIACRIKGDVIVWDEFENENIREENIHSDWAVTVTGLLP